MEQEKAREREAVQRDSGQHYEETLRLNAEARDRARKGRIVIKGKELPWCQGRNGNTKSYLSWHGASNAAAEDWTVFMKDLKIHAGKHRHQGGIQLFVLEGQGATVLDGKKVEWEKWDLIVLPVKPNGCEHQHFNKVAGESPKWIAFQYHPFSCVLGNLFEQVEDSITWKSEKQAGSG